MLTFIKLWCVFWMGLFSAWYSVVGFSYWVVYYDFSQLKIMCYAGIYIPVIAFILYLIYGKLFFWAAGL